jgi:hypothetical protein
MSSPTFKPGRTIRSRARSAIFTGSPMPVSKVGQSARSEDVVLHRLERVPLHHRHVLVGRGVEEDGGA